MNSRIALKLAFAVLSTSLSVIPPLPWNASLLDWAAGVLLGIAIALPSRSAVRTGG